jgi:hypothetical protein
LAVDKESKESAKDSNNELKGKTLDAYRFLLKAHKPVGVRELARGLKFSSPSVAQHHLTKLQSMGLVKRELGNYVVNRVALDNYIKISYYLVPRHFFYLSFAIFVLVMELTVLRPEVFNQMYQFAIIAAITAILIFCYEAFKVWRKGGL